MTAVEEYTPSLQDYTVSAAERYFEGYTLEDRANATEVGEGWAEQLRHIRALPDRHPAAEVLYVMNHAATMFAESLPLPLAEMIVSGLLAVQQVAIRAFEAAERESFTP